MNFTIIKTKKDVERFLALLYEFDSFTYEDSSLCMKGNSRLSFNDDGNLQIYSFGMNWQDQIESIIPDAIGWVYKNRKYINAEINKPKL